jgi:hypothetical protein
LSGFTESGEEEEEEETAASGQMRARLVVVPDATDDLGAVCSALDAVTVEAGSVGATPTSVSSSETHVRVLEHADETDATGYRLSSGALITVVHCDTIVGGIFRGKGAITSPLLDAMSQARSTEAGLTVCLGQLAQQPPANPAPIPGGALPSQAKPVHDKRSGFHGFPGLISGLTGGAAPRVVLWRPLNRRGGADLAVRKSVLRTFPNLTVSAAYVDTHVYVFSVRILRLLQGARKREGMNLRSFPLDVVPLVVRAQSSRRAARLLGLRRNEVPLVAAVVAKTHLIKVSSIPSFTQATRDLARVPPHLAWYTPTEPAGGQKGKAYIATTAVVDPKTSIGVETIVGEDVTIGTMCTVKKSVFGPGCSVDANARIINSILLEGVTVGAGATVTNSILCPGSTVGPGATINNAILAREVAVEGETVVEGEARII